MSHFVVGVIVPIDGDASEHVARLLGPFDENMEWPPYEEPYDVMWFARSDTGKKRGLTEESSVEDVFNHYIAEYGNDEEVYLRDGQTYYKSHRNPKSQWDWYVVGGRWDGIWSKEKARNDAVIAGWLGGGLPHDKSQYENHPERNVLAVADWLALPQEDRTPFAFVTPAGEWIEKGAMGWWATVSNEKNQDAWRAEATTVAERFPDHRIVTVDCHI